MSRFEFSAPLIISIFFVLLGAFGCEGTLEGDFDDAIGDEFAIESGESDEVTVDEESTDDRFDPVRDLQNRPSDTETDPTETEPDPMDMVDPMDDPTRPAPGTFVDFHIEPGTADGAWNARDAAVSIYVGQILRVYNDDDQDHQIHSPDGGPFPHGQRIQPGAFATYEVVQAMELGDNNRLYDHNHGRSAAFWIESIE